MDEKDLEVLDVVRRRHRHARLAELLIAGMALLHFAGAAFLFHRWNRWTIEASAPGPEWRPLGEMVRNGLVSGIVMNALGAFFLALTWGFVQSRRRSDALLLKLAEERVKDLDVPR